MTIKQRYSSIGGILLLALALAACGPTGTAGQAPSAAPAATTAPTAAPIPPTMQPTSAPTTQPTALPVSDVILPSDMPWIRIAGKAYGDDETLDFRQRGLPIPAYQFAVAPDGSYMAYISQEGMFAVIDMRTGSDVIGDEEGMIQTVGHVFSPDSRSLALTQLAENNTWRLQLRDLESGAIRTLIEGPIHASTPNDTLPLLPRPVAWTPNGLVVEDLLWASDAPPRNIALVNPADGSKRVLREDAHVNVYPSHDGTKVAVVTGALRLGEPPTTGIEILEVASGQQQAILPVQQRLVRKISWSPDDQKLLYALSADYQAPATTIHARNADGSGEQVLDIGTPDSKAAYGDIAWQDNQVALLLSPETDGYAHLYALPLDAFDITGLQPVAAFEHHQANQAPPEIIYTPN